MPNPLLALQVQPANIDVAGSLNRGAEMQTARLGNMLAQYNIKKAQAADQRANALAVFNQQHGAGLVAGNAEDVDALAAIDPEAALGIKDKLLGQQKTQGDIAKSAGDVKQQDIDIALKRADFMARTGAGILGAPPEARPLLYKRALQMAQGVGMDVSKAPQEYDENSVKAMMDQGLALKDRIDNHQKEVAAKETGRHNLETERLTGRAQDMSDRRAREANRDAKAPAGYRFKADKSGNLEVIPGGPADSTGTRSKATDAQRVTALFADRALEANKILVGKGKEGDKDFVPGVEDASADFSERNKSLVPVVGNYLVSEKFQKADQAKRDFINAVLRKESGAVIGKDEFENAELQYFPQPGDTDAVKAQKRANRDTAIRGLRRAAGSAIEEEAAAGHVIDFNNLPP